MSWSLIVFLGLNFATALSGSYFKPGEWHQNLTKPSWHPPNWAFPLVWSLLYLFNAVAGWLVWSKTGIEGPGLFAMIIYAIGLVLNAGWSAIFFGLRQIRLALAEACLLWLSIAVQMIAFLSIDTIAGLLIAPYLIWVSIAILLNRSMLKLNPSEA
ncbi:MAG: TspO/MBR family protein [Pseudomonadota bacterium]